MARILILNGADLNTRDVEGWTPLHAAAACGNLQIINLMVDSGADLVALNHDDKMPVDVGCDADIQYILQQKMLEAGMYHCHGLLCTGSCLYSLRLDNGSIACDCYFYCHSVNFNAACNKSLNLHPISVLLFQ